MDDTKRIISKSILTATADAIRAKDGTSATITPSDFATKITAIPTGKPEEVANVTPSKTAQTINPTSGSVFSSVSVSAVTSAIDSNIKANNIKSGVTILGVTGNVASAELHDIKTIKSLPARIGSSSFTSYSWNGDYKPTDGEDVWTDGTYIYYSNGVGWSKYDFSNNWVTQKGSAIYGRGVWTDGINIYYSWEDTQYKRVGNSWNRMDWGTNEPSYGYNVWTDGTNIYYNDKNNFKSLILNKNTNTWSTKEWNNNSFSYFDGRDVWSDGNKIYLSDGSKQYYLSQGTWVAQTWTGLTTFSGRYIWTNGQTFYYSQGSGYQYYLSGTTWESKTWSYPSNESRIIGTNIWTYKDRIYLTTSGYTYYITMSSQGIKTQNILT